MSEITTIRANGLEFGCLSAGPSDGPLALLLHGFPDTPHSWRHLSADLAEAGYRVVAPYMRGYAPTPPAPDGAYQTGALASDANALHEALGGDESAVLIGHDWGAAAVYSALASAPGRWRRAVTMALPPVSALLDGFFSYEQLKRSFYIFLFQTPLAEMALDEGFIVRLWRDWSPGHDEDLSPVLAALGTPESRAAAIGYYRAMLDPSLHLPRYAAEQEAADKVGTVPLLYLHGADDGCLGADVIGLDGGLLDRLPPGSRTELVADAGHFLQVEQPGTVNKSVLGWL
ncbi:alpha/beta hydrolase [Actinocorallia sp. B10E7]|uniref:alpha/beta fold hydrolase n=1 Tax=Actinocorallia sp. B10E7 TaxID=3153558 RepID=UPI00325F560E